jgi:hypothetical protein
MKRLLLFVLLVAYSLLLGSCAPTGVQFKIVDYLEYETTVPTQSKGGVTLSCQPISRTNMHEYPELFAFNNTYLPEDWRMHSNRFFEEDASGKRWAYTFGIGQNNLTVAKVVVENGTDHILRMGDARIYLRIDGYDPIKPYTILGSTRLVSTLVGDEYKWLPEAYNSQLGLVGYITNAEVNFDKARTKGFSDIMFNYPIGLRSQVISGNRSAYKLISDVDLEILPGDTYTGFLMFPAEVIQSNPTIKFYDITIKTDAAGNPTEKVTFEFPLTNNHIQKWFDETLNKWVDGAPPKPVS